MTQSFWQLVVVIIVVGVLVMYLAKISGGITELLREVQRLRADLQGRPPPPGT